VYLEQSLQIFAAVVKPRHLLVMPVMGLLGCSEDVYPWELPPVAASSDVYVDYSAWADTSALCMAASFGEWERFIESSSDFLAIDRPKEKIRFVWVPGGGDSSYPWPCDKTVGACARLDLTGYQAVIFDGQMEPDNGHEFVHAIESPAMGRAHPVFEEGMAEYLSYPYTTNSVVEDFVEAFPVMVDKAPRPDSYLRAMHFVGSLLEKKGLETYKIFRARVPQDGKFSDFLVAYQEVYQESLQDALVAMSASPIQGRGERWGCRATDVALKWTDSGFFEQELAARCDGLMVVGPGSDPPSSTFYQIHAIDTEVPGIYEVDLRGLEGASVLLESCPGYEQSAVSLVSGQTKLTNLFPGRQRLRVNYPAGAELKPVTLTLASMP